MADKNKSKQIGQGTQLNLGSDIRQLLDALPFYVLLLDEDHHILLANKAVTYHLGLSPEQIIGGYCPKVVHGLSEPFPDCPLEEAVQKGHSVTRELFDNNSGRWLASSIYPSKYKTQDGRAVFIHIVHDITDRKLTEEELRGAAQMQAILNAVLNVSLQEISLERQLMTILECLFSIPWIAFESKGSIFLVKEDPGVLVMGAQIGLEDPILNACARVPFGRCLCGRAALTQKMQFAEGLDDRHEIRYEGIAPHGHYCVPILYEGNTVGVMNFYLPENHRREQKEEEFLTAIAGVVAGLIRRKNIEKEKKRVQVQLQQSQKMEAIGTLAGGVAHDFNNILTAIIGNADLALMDLGKNTPIYQHMEEIKKAGHQAAALTRQLLAFSRKEMIRPEVLDLNSVTMNLEKMLRRLIGEDIELVTAYAPDLGQVEADPGQMEQVIMNLSVNARDAMPKGGKLIIETANVELDERYFREHGVENEAGPFVMLAVTDNGIGMDKETQARIFEPFFTTKERGRGTGLGLSTVYGIVKQNKGHIWVYSEEGKGTTFKVYLPRVGADIEGMEEEQSPERSLRGSETILVAEDNEMVRNMARKMLERYGYRVLTARDGKETIKISGSHDAPIHLILTDVVMPGMSGRDLVDQLQAKVPEIKVLYMSGYTDNAIAHHGVLEKDVEFIQKPFSREGLARKVREVLDK